MEKEADGYKYVYQFKDHLGNIRLSYKDADKNGSISQSEIIEEKNYYPFGMTHSGYNTTVRGREHNYGYNGKEEQSELGLEWLDFGARNFDASLGRWMNIDPLANKYYSYSPYNYTANNPISFIDPDGRELKIAGNRKQRRRTLRTLRKLTNNRLKLNRKTGVVSIGRGARNRSKSLKNGTGLISRVIGSKNTATIKPIEQFRAESKGRKTIEAIDLGTLTGNGTEGHASPENLSNGVGGDVTVIFDQNDNGSEIKNEDGSTGRPTEIGLGHELLHADNMLSGNVDDGDAPEDIEDPDTRQEGVLSAEEISVRENENEIRSEQGVKQRKAPINNTLKNLQEFLNDN
ncbi:RHS repeat-associated core domain-containing protein [Aquimarina longa]|uniref:RHS repeat-associated core domain-containing protein n=1 Tax=Aquimarina longa TaxID=1080221 RepID=UPI0007865691|nr:RHS repeat-associated core domain-containing protein [Aquimarina longa]